MLRLPKNSRVTLVKVGAWPDSGVESWSESLDQPMHHYLTSLTSLLNFVYLRHPGCRLLLGGVDFNNAAYFFNDEISFSPVSLDDKTSDLQRRHGQHSALIQQMGAGTLLDRLPMILQKLRSVEIEPISLSRDSLLVRRGLIESGSL